MFDVHQFLFRSDWPFFRPARVMTCGIFGRKAALFRNFRWLWFSAVRFNVSIGFQKRNDALDLRLRAAGQYFSLFLDRAAGEKLHDAVIGMQTAVRRGNHLRTGARLKPAGADDFGDVDIRSVIQLTRNIGLGPSSLGKFGEPQIRSQIHA